MSHIEEDAVRSVRPQGVKNGDNRIFESWEKVSETISVLANIMQNTNVKEDL
jgi:hypothetical protein